VQSQQVSLNYIKVKDKNISFLENNALDISILQKYICAIQMRAKLVHGVHGTRDAVLVEACMTHA